MSPIDKLHRAFWILLTTAVIGWILYSIAVSHPNDPWVDTRDPYEVPCNTAPNVAACP